MNLSTFKAEVQKLELSLSENHDVTTIFCEEAVLIKAAKINWDVARFVVIAYLGRRVKAAVQKRFSWMSDSVWDATVVASKRNQAEAMQKLEKVQGLSDSEWARLTIPGYSKCWEISDAVISQI